MRRIAVIPARLGSTRLKDKVLADVCGKSMVRRVWESVSRAKLINEVIVAVDDKKVLDAVISFGGKAVLTSAGLASGSDRVAEVMKDIQDADVVLNVQADEPLLRPEMIDELAGVLEGEKEAKMATLVRRIEKKEEIGDPNVVKVALAKNGYALYFSRSPIPYTASSTEGKYFKHIGVYAYTRDFLFTFTRLAPTFLEKEERLEQLRALENGYKIKTRETKYETVSVDTAEDLEKVRGIIANDKFEI